MITIPRSSIEPIITDALSEAKRTKKTQFVMVINWDDLYASLGFTSDEGLKFGKVHATVNPDGSVIRHWLTLPKTELSLNTSL